MSISTFALMENLTSPPTTSQQQPQKTSSSTSSVTPKKSLLTDNFGHPLGDVGHSLNINGYVAAQDVWLMEKQQTFNRAKIVERMVHPAGAGAFGYFEVTDETISQFCKADFLSAKGKKTPVFVRFSTVTVGKEFPDSCRNPRGFALKFYTEDGNYDVVGLNFPVFFVRDPALGPDTIRAQQRNPSNFLIDYNSWFDFFSLVPESLHCATMLFSDYGTPNGFRQMHGYGCHAFKWVNDKNSQFYVKYHFISENGISNLDWDQAVRLCGQDPDYSKRDLWEHLNKGEAASWKFCVQIMSLEQADQIEFDPFDTTKVWPHSDFPLREVGRVVLNRNPDNYHRDVEQSAFSPGSLVPGIEPSPDPLLQFRCFFYRDAQMYRLGANMHQIPVNSPFRSRFYCPFSRDGLMRIDQNGSVMDSMGKEAELTPEPHYFPNSSGMAIPEKAYDWQPVKIDGLLQRKSVSRQSYVLENELEQARNLYLRVMNKTERQHLHSNIAVCLRFCRKDIQMRMLVLLHKASPDYALGVIESMKDSAFTPQTASETKKEEMISFEEVESISKQLPLLSDPFNNYQLTDQAKALIPPILLPMHHTAKTHSA